MNATSKIEAATLSSAMALAFAEIEGATKSANNPHFKTKYADLGAVIGAIKPALINHGLFFTQQPQPSANGITVRTVLHHASGESLDLGELFVPANKQDAQGYGSALTYARRYALVTAFGVPVEDDDGNAAAKAGGGQSSSAQSAPAANADNTSAPELPTGPINDKTRDWLASKIDARQIPVGDLCRAFGAASLKQITYAQIDLVKAWIADWKPTTKPGFGEVLADEIPY